MPDRFPFSGGERQRAAICQNLARRLKVLLLDEPFSAIDVENRRRLRQELKDKKEELSIPIIHVTHDLTEASFLGHSILPIAEGKMAPEWLQQQLETKMEDQIWLDGWRKAS